VPRLGGPKTGEFVQCHYSTSPAGPWTFLNVTKDPANPGIFGGTSHGTNPTPVVRHFCHIFRYFKRENVEFAALILHFEHSQLLRRKATMTGASERYSGDWITRCSFSAFFPRISLDLWRVFLMTKCIKLIDGHGFFVQVGFSLFFCDFQSKNAFPL
jgi:hypothetical protein